MSAARSRKAVFFDRDGVLNVDRGYVYRIEDFEWMPGAPEAVARVKASGRLAIVVTNQSGIGRGYYKESDMHLLHAWMNDDLQRRRCARIDAFYFCPYHPEAALPVYRHPNHPDRKPNPGMLLRAMKDYGLEPTQCVMIGDQESDMRAARAAGILARWHRPGRSHRLTETLFELGMG